MDFDQKNVVFRREYYEHDISNKNFDHLIEYQLTPVSPYIYSDPVDILDATISKDENLGGYCVDMELYQQ